MSTILPFGAVICQDCRTPVAIVRRTAEVPCDFCRYCDDAGNHTSHTHAVPDVAWAIVDEAGERHLCGPESAPKA